MALGKGLGALLGDAAMAPKSPNLAIPISQIEAAASQPRKQFEKEPLEELCESIRQHGVLQPITVRKLPTGYYQIIAGERRWRAARMAGLTEIPALIIEADDRTAMELALIENLQREDLNALEEAEGYNALIENFGLTQEEAAKRVGRSRSAVTNALRLLNMPNELKQLVAEGRLTAGHARAAMKLRDPRQQVIAAQIMADRELSVRQAEALADRMAAAMAEPKFEESASGVEVNYLSEVERDLSASLGRKVNIVTGKRKGKLEIEYYGGEDLEALINAIRHIKF